MDRGAWQATVRTITQCQTPLRPLSVHACIADYKAVAAGFYSRHIYCFKKYIYIFILHTGDTPRYLTTYLSLPMRKYSLLVVLMDITSSG